MKLEDLNRGMLVQVAPGHPHGGRRGRVLEVGNFELLSGGKLSGAVVDIGEAGLLVVSPQYLERVEPNPLLTGWEEVDI